MLDYRTYNTRLTLSLLAVLSLLHPRIAKGDNYLWPLPASSEITSGFCQWRPGHFHSGIDIRTFGKTGYKARAIADGHVFRIVTRWRGYGKALYLKLDDGRIAVYGHLLKFTPEIDRYVQEQQLAARRYRTDLYPAEDQFRFDAGDVVAYTGGSGTSSAPHLHFEIRTGDEMPLDPLQFYPSVKDGRSPAIRSLSLRPLSPVLSRIDGKSRSAAVTVSLREGRYVSNDTLVVHGPVGVELECVDKRSGTNRSYAVSGIEMYVDDLSAPFFATTYDTISFERWGEVNLELNYARALQGDKFVHNLYSLPGNIEPVVNDFARNRGWIEVTDSVTGIDLSPGLHKLHFRVSDRSGNSSRAEVVIDLRCPPSFPGMTFLGQACAGTNSGGWEYSVAKYDSAENAFVALLSGEDVSPFLEYLSGDITLLSRFREQAGSMLLLSATASDGSRFERLIRLSETGMPVFAPVSYIPPSCLALSPAESCYDPVKLDVRKLMGAWNERTAYAGSLCLSLPVLLDPVDSSLSVTPADVAVRDIINADYRRPFAAGGMGTNSIAVKFAGGHFIIEGHDLMSRNAMSLDTVVVMVGNLGQISAIRLSPQDLLLNDMIDLTLRIPEHLDSSRSAVYMLTDDGKAEYVGGSATGDSAINVKLSKTGVYAALQDTVSPVISELTPADGGRVSKSRPMISFVMYDDLSGIEDDTYVEITVDGVWAIPEYDIGKKRMITYSSQKLKPGTHSLEIRVRDRAGNEANHSSTFRYVK